jgi:prepilin-type N-terminal cleavage/methylation domain-containing protein
MPLSPTRDLARIEFSKPARQGFTLIELLVVVTIIVVLLALLTPALDKAIYQAELVMCGAQQKGVINGVIAYAMDHSRHYPGPRNRYVPNNLTTGATAEVYRGGQSDSYTDDRPRLRPYFSVNLLQCPPAGKVDLDQPIDLTRTPDGTYIHASMDFWFGWKFDTAKGGQGMNKVGDRWVWDGQRFGVLVNDISLTTENSPTSGNNYTSHPDADGVFVNLIHDNDGGPFTNHMVWAGWWGGAVARNDRGPVHLNAGFDDGSVQRYESVGWHPRDEEDRMASVPRWEAHWPNLYHLVPRR